MWRMWREENLQKIILTGFFFVLLGFMGLWFINDSMACVVNFGVNSSCGVGNGFWWLSPVQAFHIGLWLVMFALAFLFTLVVVVA